LPKYPNGLTKREVEVLCLVAEGLTNKAIAQRLRIELRTVTTYLTTAYSKIRASFDRNEGQVAQRVAAAHFVEDHDLC
jgi:NarL family two-component system response regulator LiaR